MTTQSRVFKVRTGLLRLLCALAMTISAVFPSYAQSFVTSAKQAILVDYETGAILFQKNAFDQMPTSSMSKVMTAYMMFDSLKAGKFNLDDTFPVSEKAWKKGGSKMFVEVGKQVSIEDLLRGVIIQSGNDATIVLAEGLSGTETAFALDMTDRAHELGMKETNFANASGWPDPLHYSTANDLAILAKALIENHPEYYKYYGEKEFTFNEITQRNRNPLLYRNMGADGIKTGHTEAGGYGLMGSGVHKGRRAIFVINGLESEKARASEGAKILEYGLRYFENKNIFKADETLEKIPVTYGQSENVSLALSKDVYLTLPKRGSDDLTFSVKAKVPVKAPIAKGDELGILEVNIPGQGSYQYPLYAANDVARKGFFGRAIDNIVYMLKGMKQEALKG